MQIFKPVNDDVTSTLINFARDKNNVGSSFVYLSKKYTLDLIDISLTEDFNEQDFSIYYTSGRDTIRIADRWSFSNGYKDITKLNCGVLSNKISWGIDNNKDDLVKIYDKLAFGPLNYLVLAGVGRPKPAELSIIKSKMISCIF